MELSRSAGLDGRLMHADVRIGDSILMLNDHFPELGSSPITEGSCSGATATASLWTQSASAGRLRRARKILRLKK